jgi:hypothetical protein
LPLWALYLTARTGPNAAFQYAEDLYRLDEAVIVALDTAAPTPSAPSAAAFAACGG